MSELWLTDGTRDGTRVVADGFAGLEIYESTSRETYFVINDTAPRSAGDLWVSDGTVQGTRPTGARVPAGVASLGLAGPKLILMDCNSLFVTDTVHAAVAFHQIAVLSPPFGSPLHPFHGVGESFVLLGHPDFGGMWVTDGTPAGTGLLASCGGGTCGFSSGPFPLRDGRFAFTMFTEEFGSEPWISDGTPTGTRLLADLCPGSCSSSGGARLWRGPNLLLLFGYPTGSGVGARGRYFLLDESTGEIEALPEIPDYSSSGSYLTAYLANDLVYLAHSAETGFELHRIHVASPPVRGRAGLPRSRR